MKTRVQSKDLNSPYVVYVARCAEPSGSLPVATRDSLHPPWLESGDRAKHDRKLGNINYPLLVKPARDWRSELLKLRTYP